jgi:hypothetical protein
MIRLPVVRSRRNRTEGVGGSGPQISVPIFKATCRLGFRAVRMSSVDRKFTST